MKRYIKGILTAVILIGAAGTGGAWLWGQNGKKPTTFHSVPVKRGDIVAAISATGTVEPEEVINVGAQVAGRIVGFGTDDAGRSIDYGSTVEEGMVLAIIDDSLYAADTDQAAAQLAKAHNAVLRAEADLEHLQAKLVQAEREWTRAKKLGPCDALSQSRYDAAQSDYEVARANVAVGKTAILEARSTVAEAEANLRRARKNLDYCTIRSPVKGVIIDRRVNIGQTVVASLSAPSLFLIAKDLKRMQVWVSVNEADIGSIRPGGRVEFTADAFPRQTFRGEVGKVRLNATMTQNVVTYTVEVLTDNSDGRLLPYLSANVKFLANERRDVLTVPNAALRYIPPMDRIKRDAMKQHGAPAHGGHSHGKEPPAPEADGSPVPAVLWTPQDDLVRSIQVMAGLSDGTVTEIQSEELKEGTPIVVSDERAGATDAAAGASPFAPRLFSGGKGGGHGH